VNRVARECLLLTDMWAADFRLFFGDISHINIVIGFDNTIQELSYLTKDVVSFDGYSVFDDTYPDVLRVSS